MHPLSNLWRKAIVRNPSLAINIKDTFLEMDLTPEEKELINKELGGRLISAGKYIKNIYGSDVETLEEAVEREHEKSLEKQRDTIKAYDKDVEGSFQKAKENAYKGSFFNRDDSRDEFINRVRSVAKDTFERERKEEINALSSKYNIDKNQVKSDIIDVLDIPVSMAGAVGRDMGEMAGKVQNAYTNQVSGVLGEDSYLSKGLDKTSRLTDAVYDDVTDIVTASPWITKGLKKIRETGDGLPDLPKVNGFLDGLHDVHMGWLRKFLGDFADILEEWYHDPRTLCCFVKNIAAWATSSTSDFKNTQQKYFKGEVSWTNLTGTRKFFDKLIVILKIIKGFLSQDVSFNLMLNLDLGLAMSKASLSALMAGLMVLQQMLEDQIYYALLKVIEENTREEWRQCFPFERLLKIIADFITGPDGIFKYIEQYIDSFLTSFSGNVNFGFNAAKKQKMIDITAIDKLIAMLEAIRDGLLNLELCIEADFSETDQLSDDAGRSEKQVGFGERNYSDLINKIKSDRDTGARTGVLDDGGAGRIKKVIFPTDTEVKAFVMNRMGESESFADQVIATANKSSNIFGRSAGSLDSAGSDEKSGGLTNQIQKAIGDCSRTLDSDKILELSNLMADWDLGL